jgi:large subunit ribosomal protein L21
MYAVVTTGGKQYRVEAGSELVIERLTADVGASITFDRVLLVGDGEAVTVGTPTVAGATVSGTVLREELGPKLIIFKFKQKATYRRKNGHRQHLTRVRIDEITTSHTRKTPSVEADTDAAAEKPKRTRKPAVVKAADKADATEAAAEKPKPKRARKPAAKKAESEE